MKKITALLLCALIAVSSFVLVSCGGGNNENAKLKLGLGVYSVAEKATDADGDTNGAGQAVITAAAVLVDADGKIVKCVIDTADNTVSYTSAGKAVANTSFKTKYELGADYGMKSPYGSTKEWYEHVDAFCALVKGKTVSEVKAYIAEGGNGDVIAAGCTIAIADFVYAIEKAVANAKDSNATANSALKLGMNTTQEIADATDDKAGSNALSTDIFAAAVDAEGKIVAAINETVEVDFTFDVTGKSTFDKTKAIKGKRELGDAYGMKSPYGSAKEWYEHADAFVAACIGKKASEIASIATADIQAAGCTIAADGFVKAASKVG
ncbi:MAG: hypothetical protein IJ021_05500 [Clostridia bacterium]|nr:hypothetical protein [Clostridia bacterium]